MIKETLKSLGLNDKEIEAYLNILPLGNVPSSVIGRRLNIPRSTARYICQQLANKGLLKSIQKGRSLIYSPESPEKILYLLEQQKNELNEKETNAHRIIGDLKNMINPHTKLPKLKYYEGPYELIELLRDVFTDNEPLFGFLKRSKNIHPQVKEYVETEYIPSRIKSKQPACFIFNDDPITRAYRKKDKAMNRKTMLVPQNEFPFNVDIHIYDNKVAFYSDNKDDATGILIENRYIRNTMFSLFKMTWEFAKNLSINKKKKE